jgi:hypothetical protein
MVPSSYEHTSWLGWVVGEVINEHTSTIMRELWEATLNFLPHTTTGAQTDFETVAEIR